MITTGSPDRSTTTRRLAMLGVLSAVGIDCVLA
jgi:hypothetical protein